LPEALTFLKKGGFTIVAFSGDGEAVYTERNIAAREVFLFGSEAHGISREARSCADEVVRIPRFGKAESLTVGVACGIVLAHRRAARPGGA